VTHMRNIPELYILGKPIDTDIGKLYFIKIKDYDELLERLNILLLEKNDLINIFKEISIREPVYNFFLDYLNENSLFDFLCLFKKDEVKEIWLVEFYNKFKELFEFCFKEDVFDLIKTNEEFENYRELIKTINCVDVEKPNPNPEIERRNQLRKLLQQEQKITFESMFTSIEVLTGRDPNEMTIYRFNKLFDRVAQVKNYDSATLLFTAYKDVKVEPWYKEITVEKKEGYITDDQLRKAKKKKVLLENF